MGFYEFIMGILWANFKYLWSNHSISECLKMVEQIVAFSRDEEAEKEA